MGGIVMSKRLVAYFSASGVTRHAAQMLAEAAEADLFEIRPTVAYTAADLDWTNKKSRSSVEMRDAASRPEVADMVENMERYDTVFVGFPIWWYVAPSIINTFLERYDFSGKTMIPFATSGGSGFGKAVDAMKALCAKTAVWKPGKLLNRFSRSDLDSWLSHLE